MSQSLSRPFTAAGLRLELPLKPLQPFDPEIFQMDIFRNRGPETFRLWKGHETNSIRVTDTDKDRRQLVLLVQEEPRPFETRVSRLGRYEPPPEFRALRLLKVTEQHWLFQNWTPATMRRYLCGMDERHLFIAQFEGGTTVKDAHRKLKPKEVLDADRSNPRRTLRQGEWFFVKPSPAEARLLSELIRAEPHLVERHRSLGGNGRPHMADELLHQSNGRVFARGRIRHPDHKTLILPEWRRVFRNAEVRSTQIGGNGVYWID